MPNKLPPVAHVYAPVFPRTNALIAGSREALMALRAAIDRVLAEPAEESADMVRLCDKESSPYYTLVACLSQGSMEATPVPYSDAVYRDEAIDMGALEAIPVVTKRLIQHRKQIEALRRQAAQPQDA